MEEILKEFAIQYQGEIHTHASAGYEFLDQEDAWISFANPHGSSDMMIRTNPSQVHLFFDHWFHTYKPDGKSLQEMFQLIRDIFDDKCYLWKIVLDSQVFVTLVCDSNGSFYDVLKQGMDFSRLPAELALDLDSIEQSFVFWDPKLMEPVELPFYN